MYPYKLLEEKVNKWGVNSVFYDHKWELQITVFELVRSGAPIGRQLSLTSTHVRNLYLSFILSSCHQAGSDEGPAHEVTLCPCWKLQTGSEEGPANEAAVCPCWTVVRKSTSWTAGIICETYQIIRPHKGRIPKYPRLIFETFDSSIMFNYRVAHN